MVRPYSEDLRQRVIAAVEEDNLSCREAARRFRVSVASAVKWLQAWRRSHRARARPMGGDRRSVLKPLRQWLLRLIEREDDLTLVAISGRLMAEHGVKADPSMLSRFIRAEGISYKKSLFASEQDRPDVKRRRERWKRHQGKLDPARLVFIDETWTKTNMTPTRGRCARGERLIAKAPFGKWRTLTFLAALRRDRIEAPILFDGPINGIKFRAYVENALVPTLHPGDVVIMDNLGSHKGRPSGPRSARPAHTSSSCRPTRQTSTQSRWSSQSSRTVCERPRPEPRPGYWRRYPTYFQHSHPRSARIIFAMPDMLHRENKWL